MGTRHSSRLGLTGVALTQTRNNRYDTQALTAVRDEIEAVLDQQGFLDGAAFSWVTVSVRYGVVNADEPVYQSISKKYGDLPLAIEVDTRCLIGADIAALRDVFKQAVVLALVHAGKRYGRPTANLEALLRKR